MRALGLFVSVVVLALGYGRCAGPGRNLAAARRDVVKSALTGEGVLTCEDRDTGFACQLDGEVAWCPKDEALPCLALDESVEVPW